MSEILAIGADQTGCAARPTPREEIKTLKERGFRCVPPRYERDDIAYEVGGFMCRIVQHKDVVYAPGIDKVDGKPVEVIVAVEEEPDADTADVILTDVSQEPPITRVLNETPLFRRDAIVTAIHELYMASQDSLPRPELQRA